jgi:hypothetical protein
MKGLGRLLKKGVGRLSLILAIRGFKGWVGFILFWVRRPLYPGLTSLLYD